MFSVLSRLTKPGEGKKSNAPAPMSSALQKKFARGVNYNMKILIKGDRNVGKSCLLQRLQGGPFIEEYRPTDQIQVAPIHWAYKATDHIVKVEVWEVVDKGRAKKKGQLGLKLDNASLGNSADIMDPPPLDATFLDVYKNANGVILMMDITKPWTFDYVQRELAGIPADIPVIILGNHCDMHHHRQVHPHQIEQILDTARETRSGSVRYAEASMRNGFGLRLLHRFLSVPFLQLQRATLLSQLTVNQQETDSAHVELDEFQNSEESDYAAFLEKLASKRRQEISGASMLPRLSNDKSPSIVLGGGKPIIPPNVNPLASSNIGVSPNKPFLGSVPPVQTASIPTAAKSPVHPQMKPVKATTVQPSPVKSETTEGRKSMSPSASMNSKIDDGLEDFCAGVLDHSFLDDLSPGGRSQSDGNSVPNFINSNKQHSLDSDSEGEYSANPLVVGVQDDLDSADEEDIPPRKQPSSNSDSFTLNENITKNSSKTAKILQLNSPSTNNTIHENISTYTPSEKVFTPFNEFQNNLRPDINEVSDIVDANMEKNAYVMEKFSLYDGNMVDRPSDDDIYDSGPELMTTNAYGVNSMWPIDASIRRSPEGGEDVSPDAEIKKEKKSKEDKKHKKKKSKDKEKDRSGSDKEKKSHKDKEKKHKEKKPKKRDSDEYLEEFLNGKEEGPQPAQEAYETF